MAGWILIFPSSKILSRIYNMVKWFPIAFGEEKIVEVKKTDAADYVMEVQIGNQMVQGETIREILDLPSSCFTVQISGDKVRFLCKGRGHGLGMSQYGAEQMALEGKNYKEILNLFFPELSIEKRK